MAVTEMVLFESSDGVVALPVEVDVAHEEVWLTRHQMSELFGRGIKTIGKHVNNALKEELAGSKDRVVAKLATTAADGKTYQVEHYGIDVILSVGYRVKSHRGIEFRAWANDVLHRYMTKGYAANDRRLRELGQTMSIVARLPEGDLSARQVLGIVQSYSRALDLLDDYDHQAILRPDGSRKTYVLTYEECRDVIARMRFGNESDLFGAPGLCRRAAAARLVARTPPHR